MILGIDFDNTLVCYDGLFHAAARERGLIPESVPRSKQGVRDYLRAVGREDDFIVLQGYVYGPGIRNASPFPYAVEGIRALLASGAEVCIISHKTRTPILGPRYDLHQAALDWLREQHFFAEGMLTPDRVFLEESKEAKAGRIADMGCTHFVDDLPEFFRLPQFPQDTRRMLFSPQSRNAVSDESWLCFHSWRAICRYCMRHGD